MDLQPLKRESEKKPIFKRPAALLVGAALVGLVLVGGRALLQPAAVHQVVAPAAAVLMDNDPALLQMHTGIQRAYAGPQDVRTGPDGRPWVVLHFYDNGMVDGDGVIVEVAGLSAVPIPHLPGPPGQEVLVPMPAPGATVEVRVTATSEGSAQPCTFAVSTSLGRAYSLPLKVGQVETFVVEVAR